MSFFHKRASLQCSRSPHLPGLICTLKKSITEPLQQNSVTAACTPEYCKHKRPLARCLSAQLMLFSGFIFTHSILLFQESRPTLVCGCSVGVDCVLFLYSIMKCVILPVQCSRAAVCSFCCQRGLSDCLWKVRTSLGQL